LIFRKQVNADVLEMIVIFWVFCFTIFQKKQKRERKTNIGNKTTFLLMMVIN